MKYKNKVSVVFLSVVLASCGGSGSDSDPAESGSDPVSEVQSQGVDDSESVDSNTEDQSTAFSSVAGFWDFSSTTGTNFQEWTDEGFITVYTPDDSGSDLNCFEASVVQYNRSGNTFEFFFESNPDFIQITQTASVVNGMLNVDNEFGSRSLPPVVGLMAQDLNICE